MSDDYDSPWKEILDAYFPQFLAFFFPGAYEAIDWLREYVSLDKELQKLSREAATGRRLVDKLMKVWLRSGGEGLVLIHVEVQGEPAKDFARRMFLVHHRIYDLYGKPVVSLAVLADDSPSWRPDGFGYELWGCASELRFPVVKLREYDDRWEELAASDNPFALMVMAHLKTRATRGRPERRLRWKLRLTRHLYQRGYEREEIARLFHFVDWLLALPEELADRFDDELKRLDKESNVQYVTHFERRAIERGRNEGLQQGRQRGQAELLRRLLVHRFGPLPAWAEERLEKAGSVELEAWGLRFAEGKELAEVLDGA